MGERVQSSGGEQEPAYERPPESVKPFYQYILGRDLSEDEVLPKHYVIQADVLGVNARIKEYSKEFEDESVKVLTLLTGQQVTVDLLIGCDPNSDLFIILPLGE